SSAICLIPPKAFVRSLRSFICPSGARTTKPLPAIHRFPARSSYKGLHGTPCAIETGSFISTAAALPSCQRVNELAPETVAIQSLPLFPVARQVKALPPPPTRLTIGANSNPLNRTKVLEEPN